MHILDVYIQNLTCWIFLGIWIFQVFCCIFLHFYLLVALVLLEKAGLTAPEEKTLHRKRMGSADIFALDQQSDSVLT